MRVAVYDRYWPTAGGGERFAAGIAEALADDHDVELFAHQDLDLERLSERLHVDLTDVGVRVIGADAFDVEAASADVDLFINASYTSRERNRAPFGIYVVHFPGPSTPFPRWAQPLVKAAKRLLGDDDVAMVYGSGFHGPEWLLQRQGAWTAGDAATVSMTLPTGRHELTVDIGRMIPGDLDHIDLRFSATQAGRSLGSTEEVITPPSGRLSARVESVTLTVDAEGEEPVVVEVRTGDSADVGGRRIGAAVVGIRVGSGLAARARAAFPQLVNRHWSGFTTSYDKIVANSAFTKVHVDERWHCDAGVLEPPVTMHATAEKRPIILTVGRFFPSSGGHSKKQLELVRGFRQLVEATATDWELHLVGGVDGDGEEYLAEIRRAAEGLAVHFHPNATGATLADLYGAASVYWHGAGFGEDIERHPDRLEHFGISTVEAMSAGAVPVVFGAAGQLETVADGVSGFHWTTLDELVGHTASLIDDPSLRRELSSEAVASAQRFSVDAFGERVKQLVAEVTADG